MANSDEEVIAALRAHATTLTAVELAELLSRLAPSGLTQGTLMTYFFRAFPRIPLRLLYDAAGWSRLGGDLDDDGLNRLLEPYLRR